MKHHIFHILLVSFVWCCLPGTSIRPACGQNSATGAFDLAKAIEQAQPGETIHIPAGVHAGQFRIDKPLTLLGEPGAILDAQQKGDVVQIRAAHVTLRGLTIQGTGKSLDQENAGVTVLAPHATIEDCTLRDVLFGIYLKKAPNCIIRGNTIGGKKLDLARRGDGIRIWESSGTLIEDNTVTRSRDVVIWFSDNVLIENNHVSYGRYGLHFMYSDNNTLKNNRLEHNSVGAFLMYSHNLTLINNKFISNRGPTGYGIGLKDLDGVTARQNLFIGNRVGIFLDNSPSEVDVYHHYQDNIIAYNDIGIGIMPSVERNMFSHNAFIENIEQVQLAGGGTLKDNVFTVGGVGNYWSNYTGFDLDNDGVGDVPFKEVDLFEDLMDRKPVLRLFLFSPAQQAIETAARAFPIMRPKPKVTDTSPLMSPEELIDTLPIDHTAQSGNMGVATTVLAGIAGFVLLAGMAQSPGRGESGTTIQSSVATPSPVGRHDANDHTGASEP